MAITVHIFTVIGVPVSAGQATIGSIVGIGLIRGIHTLNLKMLGNIFAGWFLTPVVALILSTSGYIIFHAI
jgi:PiT family inorganic phosphate transporter